MNWVSGTLVYRFPQKSIVYTCCWSLSSSDTFRIEDELPCYINKQDLFSKETKIECPTYALMTCLTVISVKQSMTPSLRSGTFSECLVFVRYPRAIIKYVLLIGYRALSTACRQSYHLSGINLVECSIWFKTIGYLKG